MAEVFVQHTLNPSKTVKFNIALREFVLKGYEGDRKWVLEVGTTETTSSGTSILPKYIHKVSQENLAQEIDNAIADLCSSIDWTDFLEDKYPPYIDSFVPQGSDIPIKSVVKFVIKDALPSSGIDISDLKVVMDTGDSTFDLTSEVEITGDPYEYVVKWFPPKY